MGTTLKEVGWTTNSVIITLFLLMSALADTGCAEKAGIITISGSTTMRPVAEQIAAQFMQENPKISIVVQGGGSGAGIKDASEGKVDIGMSSRELKPEDPRLITHFLGRDAIAIIVNKKNPIASLDKATIKDIFAGKIRNWSSTGGQPQNIHVIAREEGSGTRTSFKDLVMGTDDITPNAVLLISNDEVKRAVAVDELSIGFLSLGQLDDSVKGISIGGTPCTVENAVNGSYPIVRPLYFLTKLQPDGLVRKFIDYSQGPKGQATMAAAGFIAK